MGWDYRPVDGQPRGSFVLRRAGTELITIEMLPDVDLPHVRLEQIVRSFDAIDELNTPADAGYRSLGWKSKAEHDDAWLELRHRAHGQEERVRAYLNDMWKGDGLDDHARYPLSRAVYERWCDIVAAAIEPRQEMAS